jgi:hypothetical protein
MDSGLGARPRLDAAHPDHGGLLAIPCDSGRQFGDETIIPIESPTF